MTRLTLPIALALGVAPVAAAQPFTADFGFVSATGNTKLTTMNFGEKVNFKVRSWTFAQQSAYIFGKTNGVASANQLKASLRADHTFFKRVGFFAGSSYERNRFAGFVRHSDQIAGLSWRVVSRGPDTLRFDSGGVYTDELRVDGTRKHFPAARAGTMYKHSFGGGSFFTQTGEYIPKLQNTGQYRVNTETSLVAKMNSHLGVKVSYIVRYDNKPAEGFRKADRILMTGLQVSY